MRKRSLPQYVYVLLGLLVLAMVILNLGQPDTSMRPAADSYDPAGPRAFAELLQRNGFSVVVERSKTPKLRSDDVVFSFLAAKRGSIFGDSSNVQDPKAAEADKIYERVLNFAKTGGTVVAIRLPEEFNSASNNVSVANPKVVTNLITGKNYKVLDDGEMLPNQEPAEFTVWAYGDSRQQPMVSGRTTSILKPIYR